MRTIIAEYASLLEAQRAVQLLETKVSIGNVVIRDQSQHKWRRRDQRRDRSLDGTRNADFVVSMSGTADNVEQARAFLHPGAAPAPEPTALTSAAAWWTGRGD